MRVNEQGRVVGYIRPDDSWSQAYAFGWDPNTGLTSLGGYAAYAINDLGQIAGKSGKYQAAVWENGGWLILEKRQEAVAPIRSTYLDVAAPAPGPADCECSTAGPDGHTDLLLKFKTHDIVDCLMTIHPDLAQGDTIPLTLTASLADDSRLRGVDCIVVHGKVPRRTTTKKADLDGDGFVNIHDFALIASNGLKYSGTE